MLGRSQGETGVWWYAVHVYSRDGCTMFRETELASTGEFDKRESFYDGTVVKVQVDEEGRGELKA